MRGYEELIEVGVHEGRGPQSFQWRGRRYRVVQVLDTWRERVPWWRLALAREPTDLVGEPGLVHLEPERRVWRVEAAAGRLASSGVFHLVQHGERWSLHALAD